MSNEIDPKDLVESAKANAENAKVVHEALQGLTRALEAVVENLGALGARVEELEQAEWRRQQDEKNR